VSFCVKKYTINNRKYFYICDDHTHKTLNKKFKIIPTQLPQVAFECDEATDFKTKEEAENHLRKYIRLKKIGRIEGEQ
jgi:hypothetical protein